MEEEEGTAGRRERGRRGWEQKKVRGGRKNGGKNSRGKESDRLQREAGGKKGKSSRVGDGEVDNDENGKEGRRSEIRSMQRGILTYP